jgi:protein-S-isoprenylcysteine O-methyltransferase Ste14
VTTPQIQATQKDTGALTRAGGWLFRRRSWVPLPLVVLLLAAPPGAGSPVLHGAIGAALIAAGEIVRLLAVRRIGSVSRTRADRLGPLVMTGPFARVRNPLYLGNMAIWTGFAISARLAWLAIPLLALLALSYHAVVRWEEHLLESRLGEPYRTYRSRVPRWLPRMTPASSPANPANGERHTWRATLFSERGTLIAIATACLLQYIRLKFEG